MVGSPSFTPRSLVALSRALVHEPPGRVIGLVRSSRRPRLEPSDLPAEVDDLLGRHAPAHWQGLAIILWGSSEPVVPGRPAAFGPVLRVAYLIDRDDQHTITIADDAGHPLTSAESAPSGYVADVCRRVLGLPCEAETRPVGEWVMAQWLSRLLDTAADPATSARAADPTAVARLHPAFDPALANTPDDLAEATLETVAELPWPLLREQVADGLLYVESITPQLARWMDDAFFARYLLEAYRPLDELLDDLRLFLDGDTLDFVTRTVEATLAPWSPSASWP
jgi:hypothetical protein